MTRAARSSGRQLTSDPLLARPMGVLPVATMTASGMARAPWVRTRGTPRLAQETGDDPSGAPFSASEELAAGDDSPHPEVGSDARDVEDLASCHEADAS